MLPLRHLRHDRASAAAAISPIIAPLCDLCVTWFSRHFSWQKNKKSQHRVNRAHTNQLMYYSYKFPTNSILHTFFRIRMTDCSIFQMIFPKIPTTVRRIQISSCKAGCSARSAIWAVENQVKMSSFRFSDEFRVIRLYSEFVGQS